VAHIAGFAEIRVTPGIGAYRTTGYPTGHGGQILTAAAADLVTEHAAQYRSQHGAAGGGIPARCGVFAFDPTALAADADYRTGRGDVGLEDFFIAPMPAGLGRAGHGLRL